jgi:hypothetical protein
VITANGAHLGLAGLRVKRQGLLQVGLRPGIDAELVRVGLRRSPVIAINFLSLKHPCGEYNRKDFCAPAIEKGVTESVTPSSMKDVLAILFHCLVIPTGTTRFKADVRTDKIDSRYIRATHGLRAARRGEGPSRFARCYGVAAIRKAREGVIAVGIGNGRRGARPAQCHGSAR